MEGTFIDARYARPSMEPNRSRWAGRFIGLTFVLGGVAWLVIAVLVLGNVLAGMGNYALGPASSRIVAGGGAGSWFTQGLLAFMLVGIVGVGLSALFYEHVEVRLGSPFVGWRNAAAWIHLTLGGIGSAAAALLMMWGGFNGGAALLPRDQGGLGQNTTYVHVNILNPIVVPIAGLMGVALLGYLIGGIALSTAWMRARKTRTS
jgi:hypothetical protein